MTPKEIEELRLRLGSIEPPALNGDNLAIFICGHFDGDFDEEPDDDGWQPSAVAACDEVLDAINGHYAEALTVAAAKYRTLVETHNWLAKQHRKTVEELEQLRRENTELGIISQAADAADAARECAP